jgi:hypothetical protein
MKAGVLAAFLARDAAGESTPLVASARGRACSRQTAFTRDCWERQ